MRLAPMTAEWRQHTRNHPSVVMATLSLLVFTLLWMVIVAQSAATALQGRPSEVVPANSSAAPLSSAPPLKLTDKHHHPSQAEEVPEAEGEGGASEAEEEEVGEFEEGDEASELESALESAAPMAPSSTRAAHSSTMVSAGSGANGPARTQPAVQPVGNSQQHHHHHQQHHSKALAQAGATGAATSTGTSHKEVRSTSASSDKATAHHSANEDAAKSPGDSDSQSHYKNDTVVEDLFGNLVKLDGAPTRPASHPVGSTARDLGMFAFKTLLLGPLIGITLKGALIRGLVWAMISYGLHLMFPALLATLGLGTGLVGFARQLQPEYAQLLLPQLAQLPQTFQHLLPQSISLMTSQYMKMFAPVIESISSIPEESCRHRAVCEVASYLIQNSPFMSNSLQRISATVYVNFGTDYSKAWLDGIVQSDCALKYAQCPSSPFSVMASKLVEALRSANLQNMGSAGGAASAGGATAYGGMSAASAVGQAAVSQARNFFSF